MTDLELIFSMLGEAATTEIVKNTDPQGFPENQIAARQGGKIAGNARKELEKRAGKTWSALPITFRRRNRRRLSKKAAAEQMDGLAPGFSGARLSRFLKPGKSVRACRHSGFGEGTSKCAVCKSLM